MVWRNDHSSPLSPTAAYGGLALLVLHILITPYALRDPSTIAAVILQATFYLLLVFILIDLAAHRAILSLCIALIASATALRLIAAFLELHMQALADLAFALCGLITLVMAMRRIFTTRRVTPALISAAVSIYLLAGIIWAIVFHAVEYIHPGSFSIPGDGQIAGAGDLYYFSFVTLTTLGYGDVSPVTAVARSLAVFEAVFGQLFLVVLLGRLVSLQITEPSLLLKKPAATPTQGVEQLQISSSEKS